MKAHCEWTEKMKFVSTTGDFKTEMDASRPFGEESAPTPKDLVLSALCGCTAMDVIALLKKHKQVPEKFFVEADAEIKKQHPHEFVEISLRYHVAGDCESSVLLESVALSQSKYCPVSSMISRGASIKYDVFLNDKKVGEGQAQFEH